MAGSTKSPSGSTLAEDPPQTQQSQARGNKKTKILKNGKNHDSNECEEIKQKKLQGKRELKDSPRKAKYSIP